MRFSIIVFLIFCLTGCAGRQWETVSLSSRQALAQEDAKKMFIKVMDESKHEYFSSYLGTSVETDKYEIRGQISRTSAMTGGVAIQDKITTIYFGSIERLLVQKRKNSVVLVSVLANGRMASKFVTNESGYKNFLPALESLIYYSKK